MQNDNYYPENFSDIKDLKKVARKILRRLENLIADSDKDGNQELSLKLQERLLGSKESLVTVLSALAELLLKLDQAQKNSMLAEVSSSETAASKLSEADIALVEAFLFKIKSVGMINAPA